MGVQVKSEINPALDHKGVVTSDFQQRFFSSFGIRPVGRILSKALAGGQAERFARRVYPELLQVKGILESPPYHTVATRMQSAAMTARVERLEAPFAILAVPMAANPDFAALTVF